jgi:hypothetical protein
VFMQVNGQVRPAAASVAATHRPLAETALATRTGQSSDHRHHAHARAHGQTTSETRSVVKAPRSHVFSFQVVSTAGYQTTVKLGAGHGPDIQPLYEHAHRRSPVYVHLWSCIF